MISPNATTYLTAWASVGPLVGILVGHLLTRSSQRKQWLLDTRKAEFKELISAVSATTIELLHFIAVKGTKFEFSHDKWLDAHKVASQAFSDRIYIDADLKRLDAGDRFLAISGELRDDAEGNDAAARLDTLLEEIKSAARKG